MTATAISPSPTRTTRADDLRALLLLAGLAASVLLRVVVAGPAGAGSATAGIVFGVALLLTALAASGLRRPVVSWPAAGIGLAGAGVLCTVPALHRLVGSGLDVPLAQFPRWAGVVALVAVAEELLLRGALFEAVSHARGDAVAIALAAGAFALLHVPVYGWSVLPLDLAVGVALGVLRVLAGSVTAPAIAHVGADLAGWFLR